MLKKCSSWMSNQPSSSMDTDLPTTELISARGDKQNQFKSLKDVQASLTRSSTVDVSSMVSTTVRSSLTSSNEKPSKDALSTSKPNHQHKHHHHHHRHHHHHHHHHNRHHRMKNTSLSPAVVHREASNNKTHTVNTKTSTDVSDKISNETTPMDDQEAPHTVHTQDRAMKSNKGNIPLQSIGNKLVSQRVAPTDEAQVGNFSSMICGHHPTSSIFNTAGVQGIEQIVYRDDCCLPSPSTINCAPTMNCASTINCAPTMNCGSTMNCASTIGCASNSCIYQQPEPAICLPQQQQQLLLCNNPNTTQDFVCLPQQQQQQLLVCNNPNTAQDFICLPQQQQRQQQQLLFCTNPNTTQDFICSPSTTMQPTVINQAPLLNSASTCSSCAPVIYISQPSVQPSASIIIQQQQQPQIQSQPIQFIQAPQTQPAQYLQISSATPQIIQTIQAAGGQNVQPQIFQAQPSIQTIQVPAQTVGANPQILYQRPYDPVVIPFQNQQLAVAQAPMVALSQPSYAPPRLVSAVPTQRTTPGPHMFQHALVRTVANRTGVPVFSANVSGLQLGQTSMINPLQRTSLASTGRALLNAGAQPSTSAPIVPLSAGSLLIPFQPSEPPKGMIRGTLPRTTGNPFNPRNFDNIRQQIQQRAQLLAELQRQNARIPSLPIRSANAAVPPPSNLFSRNIPIPSYRPSPNVPIPSYRPSPNVPMIPPAFSSNIPQPPPIIRSQTPYTGRNTFGTSSSSSSSSRSSATSILPPSTTQAAPSNLVYSTPSSFNNARAGSIQSGPSAPYQSLRP